MREYRGLLLITICIIIFFGFISFGSYKYQCQDTSIDLDQKYCTTVVERMGHKILIVNRRGSLDNFQIVDLGEITVVDLGELKVEQSNTEEFKWPE